MPTVIGVILKKAGKLYYFDSGGLRPDPDDRVIVETARGLEIGDVVSSAKEIGHEEVIMPLRKVVRMATKEDERKDDANKEREGEAFKTCQDKIRDHDLPMKLVEAETLFDGSKLIFNFTAEGRVDFRELVKDLAATLKTRIELRQIGVRDEAKSIGGLGPCGRDLCCRTFLKDFEPVSIKMAKEQNLPLNPIKISGVCSRLMCCLKYENDVYVDFRKRAPDFGANVQTAEGAGTVIGFCAPMDAVVVELADSQRQVQIVLADVKLTTGGRGRTKSQEPKRMSQTQKTKAPETKGDNRKKEPRTSSRTSRQNKPREPHQDKAKKT
ncbi:MAG: stage 0 sporulation family protein [Actinomycetota bacterium]